jgi:hypothetical protein
MRLLCCIPQEVLPDADAELRSYLGYPLEETLGSEAVKEVVDDDFAQVAQAAVQAHESGALEEALQEGPDGFKVHAVLAWGHHCRSCESLAAPWRCTPQQWQTAGRPAAEMAEGRRQGAEAQGQAAVHAHAHRPHGADVMCRAVSRT